MACGGDKTLLGGGGGATGQASCTYLPVPSGSPAEFIVNTSNAGAGALSVTIDGPSKVKMDCQECPKGYRVTYTPMAPGSYLISIKYGGPYHIAGSPFKARVTGEPGARWLLHTPLLGTPAISWLSTALPCRSPPCQQPQPP